MRIPDRIRIRLLRNRIPYNNILILKIINSFLIFFGLENQYHDYHHTKWMYIVIFVEILNFESGPGVQFVSRSRQNDGSGTATLIKILL